ncbi:hypothetical protein EYF80_029215 [Liparis tanakae]|uniref:Secreted protein n=1 Tax=Liparis tanakae TaxID=230148 RepID=A0A4Z2H717_9TELE|nr:hypothetical protein EYF80_029215 [Liparis tanakae]
MADLSSLLLRGSAISLTLFTLVLRSGSVGEPAALCSEPDGGWSTKRGMRLRGLPFSGDFFSWFIWRQHRRSDAAQHLMKDVQLFFCSPSVGLKLQSASIGMRIRSIAVPWHSRLRL